MNVNRILKRLETAGHVFPRRAIKEAVAHREEVIPELLRVLEDVEQNADELMLDEDYMLHFYALYLLAQFREFRAYPLIVRLFSMQAVIDLIGDLVTEDLGRILASVSNGDVSLMKEMVENPTLDEYVRSAALRGFVVLVSAGELSREDALAYFQTLFRGKLEREFSNAWNALVARSTDLYPDIVYEDIQQAYQDDLVESFYIGLEEVEEVLKLDQEEALQRRQRWSNDTLIKDTIREMQNWHYFQQTKPKTLKQAAPVVPDTSGKKIGRNEPCPCGSGRKYKHCCGKRV